MFWMVEDIYLVPIVKKYILTDYNIFSKNILKNLNNFNYYI